MRIYAQIMVNEGGRDIFFTGVAPGEHTFIYRPLYSHFFKYTQPNTLGHEKKMLKQKTKKRYRK